MSETNYEDILDKGWDEIPVIKPLPEGSYRLKGQNASYSPGRGDGNPYVLFVDKPVEAMDDVSGLEALGSNYDISENRVFTRFWIETVADWDKVRNHLKARGVEPSGSIKDTLKKVKGSEVLAYLKTRVFTNGQGDVVTENVASSFTSVD